MSAAGVLGALATLLLHSLFFAAATWDGTGISRLPNRPEAIGAGANSGHSDGFASERSITVRLMSERDSETSQSRAEALKTEIVHTSLKLAVTGPDALPLPPLVFDEEGERVDSTDADLIARTTMVGIYESQIRARIERAWTLPDGYTTNDAFSCRVQIRQNRNGSIAQVELPYDGCGDSDDLRQSLINAIFTASPLPAPPHPGVFVDSFSLVLRPGAASRK